MDINKIKDFIHERAIAPGSGLVRHFFQWIYPFVADPANLQALGLWMAAILTGLVAVMYAQAFRWIEVGYERYFHSHPLWAVGLAPVFFISAWWIVYRWAPYASGSGIPQVMAAIETGDRGSHSGFIHRLLSLRTAVVKVISSLLCLAGGGVIGREGPTLQISGAIFHFVGSQLRRFSIHVDPRTWVITGAAAGLASAFNTPLGGIVYAIEELGMNHFHRVRTALLTSVIISGVVAQNFLGSYLYLGFPRLSRVEFDLWPLIILTGAAAGVLGAFFSRGLLWAYRRRSLLHSSPRLAGLAVLCGALTGVLIYLLPSTHGPGTEVISGILFRDEFPGWSLIFSRLAGMSLAFLSGSAGGVFAPSLTIGACLGSEISQIFGSAHSNLLAMLGMIGFLTGVTHAPFTAFILVMEMSDRHSAIFPMMMAALVSNSVAKRLQKKSFYEQIKDDLIQSKEAAVPRAPGSTEG